jgi:hypothetical protein
MLVNTNVLPIIDTVLLYIHSTYVNYRISMYNNKPTLINKMISYNIHMIDDGAVLCKR